MKLFGAMVRWHAWDIQRQLIAAQTHRFAAQTHRSRTGSRTPPQSDTMIQMAEQEVMAMPEAWRRTELARHPERPYPMDFIEALFTDFSEIHGASEVRGGGGGPSSPQTAPHPSPPPPRGASRRGRSSRQPSSAPGPWGAASR